MNDLKERIYKVIKEPQLMPLATISEGGKPWVRYITGWGSEDLIIRFVTSLCSRKVGHIKRNPEVHLTCGARAAEPTEHYLQISAKAKITTDKKERLRYWQEELKAFLSGPDDPNYCICIVKPYRIEYYSMTEMNPEIWESKSRLAK